MSKTHSRRFGTTGAALLLCTGLVMAGSSVVSAGAAARTPGVTAKQITIGATVPLTGIAAAGDYGGVHRPRQSVIAEGHPDVAGRLRQRGTQHSESQAAAQRPAGAIGIRPEE